MIVKVGISGASGRVGREIAALISVGYYRGDASVEMVDAVTGSGKMTSIEGVPARTWSDPPRDLANVWIDFSSPKGTLSMLEHVNSPVVIATTGFSQSEKDAITEYAKSHPVLLAPNTSPGMNLMLALLSKMPKKSVSGFSPVLAEEHHRHKKDSPSGTAVRILQALKERDYEEVPTHVTREGGIIGTHSVKFISDREEIEIVHRVSDRSVFAEGAVIGAIFLAAKDRKPGIYEMKDVFEMEAL